MYLPELLTNFYRNSAKAIKKNIDNIRQKLQEIPSVLHSPLPQFQSLKTSLHRNSEIAERRLREYGNKLIHFFQSQPKREEGEVISDDFKNFDGQIICKEVARRIKTMEIFRSQLLAEKDFWMQELAKEPLEEEVQNIFKRIAKIEQELQKYAWTQATWSSTNTPRLLFKKNGPENAKKLGLPLLGNLRTHKLEFLHLKVPKATNTNRSAAITDFVHSETNLQEMHDYIKLTDKAQALDPTSKRYFQTYYSIDIDDEASKQQLIARIKERIEKAYGMPCDRLKVVDLMSDRKDLLRRMFLQDLYAHFQENPIKSQEVFHGRIAALDPEKKPKTDAHGYHINERNELLDMKALYDETSETSIIFDIDNPLRGPYFDREGKIHMPTSCRDQNHQDIKEVSLHTLLLNTCVQGHTQNSGIQNAVNQEALEKISKMNLSSETKEQAQALAKLLKEEKKTSPHLAHKAIKFINSQGYCSVDCYGGKDRTGYIVALDIYHQLKRYLKENNNNTLGKREKILLFQFSRQLTGKEGVARRIIEDNTGIRSAFKMTAFSLKLYIQGPGYRYLLGVGRRLQAYGHGLILGLRKAPPVSNKVSILHTSPLKKGGDYRRYG